MKRLSALVLLVGLALLFGAGPAAAHDVLTGSDPADGASLPTAPSRVALQFNNPPQAGFSTVAVIGPDGSAWQTGEPQVDGTTVSVALRPLGPAGRYEVRYRVVSSDGHPVRGTVGFTLTTPGAGTAATPSASPSVPSAPPSPAPAAAPADGGSGGPPLWPWIVGAVVLVVGGVVAALRLGR